MDHRTVRRPSRPTIVLAVLLAFGAGAAGCGADEQQREDRAPAAQDAGSDAVETVDVDAAFEAADSGEVLLVDVREPAEWEAGHAGAAMHVPLATVGDQLEAIEDRAEGRPVWFICRSGSRSAQAARTATDGGLADVASVDGGMGAWVEAGHPIVPRDGRVV